MDRSNADNPPEIYEALRISKLDAAELDNDLQAMLKSQLQSVFKYIKPNLLVALAPEADALLGLILWHYSINKSGATFGQLLLDMKYVDEKNGSKTWMSHKHGAMLGLLTIGGTWIESRVEDLAHATAKFPFSKYVWRCVRLLSTLCKAASLVNFLVFLCQGKYVHGLERLLRIRSVFPNRQVARQVGYELMDRELLWHGFAEFLFFVLPLVNFRKLKNFVGRNILRKSTIVGSVDEAYRECVVCEEWPVRPYRIVDCPHVFCYYCLHSNYLADKNYSCPMCATAISSSESIRPVTCKIIATAR